MKYTLETIIDLPREQVIEKLDKVENLKHWMRGLIGVEHISGIPGEVGAKMKFNYKFGKREMALVETIIKREMPREFHANYDTKGMHSYQENFFDEIENGKTKWTSTSEFRPESFGMRVMMFLMPGAFKKQSKVYLNDFKNFVEKGVSVTEQ